MISEIREQPKAVERTIESAVDEIRSAASLLDDRFVYTTGSGSSYHASLVLHRLLMKVSNLKSTSIPSSELPEWLPPEIKNSALVAFSQSGESKDVLVAVDYFRRVSRDGVVVSVTNTPKSTLARVSDDVILTRAGEERAVAATKSYTTQLVVSFMLALKIAEQRGIVLDELVSELSIISKKMEKTIDLSFDLMEDIAKEIREVPFGFILGKGPNYPTALEGALKLRETANLHYVGYAAREFLHGPIQLVDRGTPVISLNWVEMKEVVRRVRSFGGRVIRIGVGGEIPIPETRYEFSPLLMVIPLQVLAYNISLLRGLDPDKPEKLGKVVTE